MNLKLTEIKDVYNKNVKCDPYLPIAANESLKIKKEYLVQCYLIFVCSHQFVNTKNV